MLILDHFTLTKKDKNTRKFIMILGGLLGTKNPQILNLILQKLSYFPILILRLNLSNYSPLSPSPTTAHLYQIADPPRNKEILSNKI